MSKEFEQILGMWKELDAHYDVLDNRYYSLEAVIGQLRKDILALEARLITMGERVTSGEVKDEATGDDIVEIRQTAKEQTQQVWNGIREGQIHSRVDTGKMQDDLEKLLDIKIGSAIKTVKLWVYTLTGAGAIALITYLINEAKK